MSTQACGLVPKAVTPLRRRDAEFSDLAATCPRGPQPPTNMKTPTKFLKHRSTPNLVLAIASILFLAVTARGVNAPYPAHFKSQCLHDLVRQVPEILQSQDPKTGHFGTGIWISIDQNVLLPLAAAWSYRDAQNPYYHDPHLLNAIMLGGDALIEAQDKNGEFLFLKKDGSTWGQIYQPWIYTRWLRAFQMIRAAMPPDRRARWETALLLGYNGISREERTATLHNIAAHHAMGLYFAGKIFDRPDWCQQGADVLHRVVGIQNLDGYWSEHSGPLILYNKVYVEALGVYHAVSHDDSVLDALRRASIYHAYFTYPDGTEMETVDERTPYLGKVRMPNVGFTFSPEGRGYLMRIIGDLKGPIPADDAASLLLWGQEGDAVDITSGDFDYTLPSGKARIVRQRPWCVVFSAFTAPLIQRRWIQDRQNFVSVFHDGDGLIIGGGNTKLQPRWSNFTLGDIHLLALKPGDRDPNFIPPPGLQHVPTSAQLLTGNRLGVSLTYNHAHGEIALKIINDRRLEYTVSGDASLAAHVTIMPRMGASVETAAGDKTTLSATPFDWHPGRWIEQAGVRFLLPPDVEAIWPVLPHNPYTIDGHAEASEGRIVLDFPAAGLHTITVEVPANSPQ